MQQNPQLLNQAMGMAQQQGGMGGGFGAPPPPPPPGGMDFSALLGGGGMGPQGQGQGGQPVNDAQLTEEELIQQAIERSLREM